MTLTEKIRANLSRLEAISKVQLRDTDIEELVFHLKIYLLPPEHDPLSVPDWMLKDAIKKTQPRQAPRDRRRLLVEGIEGVWRERYGQAKGSYYDVKKEVHRGPLLELIQELFRIVEIVDPPSASSIHHDLDFIYRGKERSR